MAISPNPGPVSCLLCNPISFFASVCVCEHKTHTHKTHSYTHTTKCDPWRRRFGGAYIVCWTFVRGTNKAKQQKLTTAFPAPPPFPAPFTHFSFVCVLVFLRFTADVIEPGLKVCNTFCAALQVVPSSRFQLTFPSKYIISRGTKSLGPFLTQKLDHLLFSFQWEMNEK